MDLLPIQLLILLSRHITLSYRCSFLFVLHFPDAALGQTNWDASKVQQYELLRRDIDSHAESLEIKTRKVILLSLQPPSIFLFKKLNYPTQISIRID